MEGSFPCVLSSGKWQRAHSPTARHIDENGSYKTLYLLWDHLLSSSFWDWLLDSMAKFMPLTGPEPYQELLACLPCSSFPLPSQVHPHTLFTHALYPFKHNLKPWPWPPGKTEDAQHLLLIKWKDFKICHPVPYVHYNSTSIWNESSDDNLSSTNSMLSTTHQAIGQGHWVHLSFLLMWNTSLNKLYLWHLKQSL